MTSWQMRHAHAMFDPTDEEQPILAMIGLADTLADRFGTDHVLREGIADLIKGARVLLNANWGRRLDMGSLDATLRNIAEQIGYDLDIEEFRS